jgi:hypothetical protein
VTECSSGARFLVEHLREGGAVWLVARGTSMRPRIHEGDHIFVRGLRHGQAPIRDDVAVFRSGERLVAHTVVGFAGERVLTCGANPRSGVEPVSLEATLGVVARVRRPCVTERLKTRLRGWKQALYLDRDTGVRPAPPKGEAMRGNPRD